MPLASGGFASLNVTIKSHGTEKSQQDLSNQWKEEHWLRPPFCLFTGLEDLETTQQPVETSPRVPGVVWLHANAGYFSTTARRASSPSCGLPPPCKQALRKNSKSPPSLVFLTKLFFVHWTNRTVLKSVYTRTERSRIVDNLSSVQPFDIFIYFHYCLTWYI